MNYEIGRWHPWTGGEQPVPDGTKVQILPVRGDNIYNRDASDKCTAWDGVIAFRVLEYPRRTVTIAGREVPAPMQEEPERGQRYWMVASNGKTEVFIWEDWITDRERLAFGIWSSREEAQQAADAIRAALRGEE